MAAPRFITLCGNRLKLEANFVSRSHGFTKLTDFMFIYTFFLKKFHNNKVLVKHARINFFPYLLENSAETLFVGYNAMD